MGHYGLGYQEIISAILTNKELLYDKMNISDFGTIEIQNYMSKNYSVVRSWLMPVLMNVLSRNTHVEYPQKIFEIGSVILINKKLETKTDDEERLAAVIAHANAGFSEIKSNLDAFLMNFGIKWQIKETVHSSFIQGRVGNILVNKLVVGRVGEVHPKVLEAWVA